MQEEQCFFMTTLHRRARTLKNAFLHLWIIWKPRKLNSSEGQGSAVLWELIKQTQNGAQRNINNLLNLMKHEVGREKNIESVSIISDQSKEMKKYHYLFYSLFLP